MSRGMPTSLRDQEDEVTVTLPPHPEPVQRAVTVTVTDPCVTQNARKMVEYVTGLSGWSVTVTHAIGTAYDIKTGGVRMRKIMEPTGEFTDKGNPRTKKVGLEERGPVDSIRVVARKGLLLMAGHWVDNGFDQGIIYRKGIEVRSVNWGQLWEALNAEGEKDMRASDSLF